MVRYPRKYFPECKRHRLIRPRLLDVRKSIVHELDLSSCCPMVLTSQPSSPPNVETRITFGAVNAALRTCAYGMAGINRHLTLDKSHHPLGCVLGRDCNHHGHVLGAVDPALLLRPIS